MTRTPIPSDDIDAVLEVLGVEVSKEQGDEIIALCPLHKERTGRVDSSPSWSINRETGAHHCFSCGYSGHLVGLVADLQNIDFSSARRWLARSGFGLDTAENLPGWWEKKTAGPTTQRVLEEVFTGCVDPPLSALEKRRISLAAARRYGVLWSPQERGWVLPVREADGNLLGYQFKRKRTMDNRPKSMKKSKTLFGIDVFRGGKAILVESPLDCVYLHTLGIEGAVSSFGASVSDDQMRLIVEKAEEVIVALDNDSAGRTETKRLMTGITWRGSGEKAKPVKGVQWSKRLPMYSFEYGDSEGKDPGEMQRQEIYRGLREAKHYLEYVSGLQR